MTPAARAFVCVCAGAIAFALGYALPILFQVPNFYYDPLARRFFVGERAGSLPMGYYGQIAWALSLAALVALGAWSVTGRRTREPRPGTLTLLTAWALSALVLVGVYFTWSNWP